MDAHNPATFTEVVQSLQTKLIEISGLISSHPEPHRFCFALAKVIRSFDIANGLAKKEMTLDPCGATLNEAHLQDLGKILSSYKIKYTAPKANAAPLLHLEVIESLLAQWNQLLVYAGEASPYKEQALREIQRFNIVNYLYRFDMFNVEWMTLLWNSDVAHADTLQKAFYEAFDFSNGGKHVLKDEPDTALKSFVLKQLCQHAGKAKSIIEIYKKICSDKHFDISFEQTLQKLLQLSDAKAKLVATWVEGSYFYGYNGFFNNSKTTHSQEEIKCIAQAVSNGIFAGIEAFQPAQVGENTSEENLTEASSIPTTGAIAKGIEWLQKGNMEKSEEHIKALYDNIDGISVLTNLNFSDNYPLYQETRAVVRQHVFSQLLPLIIKKHSECQAQKATSALQANAAPEEKSTHYRITKLPISPKSNRVTNLNEQFANLNRAKKIADEKALSLIQSTSFPLNASKEHEKRVYLDNGDYVTFEEVLESCADDPESQYYRSKKYIIHDGNSDEIKCVLEDDLARTVESVFLLENNHLLTYVTYIPLEDLGDFRLGGDPDPRLLKIWDLNSKQCIKSIEAGGECKSFFDFKMLSPSQIAYVLNGDLVLHRVGDDKQDESYALESYDKAEWFNGTERHVIGKIPQGVLLKTNSGLRLVDKEGQERMIQPTQGENHRFFLLPDHSLLWFSIERQERVIYGHNEKLVFPRKTVLNFLSYDADKKVCVITQQKQLSIALPTQCFSLRDDVILANIDRTLCAMNLKAQKIIPYPILTLEDYWSNAALRSDGTLGVHHSANECIYEILDLKKFISDKETAPTVSVTNHSSSIWDQNRNSATDQPDEKAMQVLQM